MSPFARGVSAAVALMLSASGLTLHTAPVSADPLAPIWNGVYVGAHGGVNWSDLDTNLTSTMNATSFSGGGHIGYNFGLGRTVLGIEADANYDSSDFGFSTAGGGSGAYDIDWNGTIRARAGLTFGPALLYATAGYAWTNATLIETSAGGASTSRDQHFDGVVYGAGIESYVLPNMSLRLEALRYDYGADKLTLTGAANSVQELDPSDTVVRAGVTFHLN